MKTFIAFVLAVSTAFAVIGCSGGDSSTAPVPPIDKDKDAATQKDAGAAPTKAND